MHDESSLFPYQRKAINHQCTHPQSMLWLDMGLGKTTITLSSIKYLLGVRYLRAVLIVAPIRVCRLVWRQEAKKWSHLQDLTFSMIVGTRDQRSRALMQKADIYLVNYENLGWLAEALQTYYISKKLPLPFDGVVYDEVTKTKNSTTKRVKALEKVIPHFNWTTGLTGTPASNGYKDLHGQYLVVDGGLRLGTSKSAFKSRFYKKAGFKEIAYDHAEDQIKTLIGDITMEMSAADYNPLPDMIINNVEVEMDATTRAQYERLEKEYFTKLDNGTEVEVFNAASLTNKCLAEGTEVLTFKGWKRIETLTDKDLVWDGVDWVSISGIVYNGYMPVIDCWGVSMTPDHKVLTNDGWVNAENVTNEQSGKRHIRAAVRTPFSACERGEQGNVWDISQSVVESPLRLRKGICYSGAVIAEQEQTKTKIMRVFSRGDNRNSQHDEYSPMGDLAQYAVALQLAIGQRLVKLRSAWNQGLSSVGQFIREVLGRHGVVVPRPSDAGTQGCKRQLLKGELPVGEPSQAGKQHSQQCLDSNTNWEDHHYSSSTSVQPEVDYGSQEEGAGLVGRGCNKAHVFDIINAGPRHRFTVRGKNSEVFIAHNCLQFSNGAVYPVPGMPLWEPIHDIKLDALEEIIDEAQGQPILCSYAYISDAERIMARFHDLKPINLTNCKSEKALNDAMTRWKSGDCRLMIGHPACLGADTQVLTERNGWVRIVDVESTDRVFDGVEFVSHSGCSYSGHKWVIDVFGMTMTPDHKLLIPFSGEWIEAQDVEDFTNGRSENLRLGLQGEDDGIGGMSFLRGDFYHAPTECFKAQSGGSPALSALHQGHLPQHDEHTHLENLARNDVEVEEHIGQKLRWSWYHGLPKMGEFLNLLRGYVTNLLGRPDHRTGRCESTLLESKLCVGDQHGATSQQANQSDSGVSGRNDSPCRTGQTVGHQQDHAIGAAEQGNDSGSSRGGREELSLWEKPTHCERSSPRKAPVYDLVDCGPRHQFVIRNDDGEVFISHNSMGHGIDGLQDNGHILVWFGLNWSLDLVDQFNARIRRQGQGAPVICHRILCKDTLDQAQALALDAKADTQTSLRKAIKEYRIQKEMLANHNQTILY